MSFHKLKHKYNAKPTTIDEIKFPSKKEAAYYQKLKFAQKSGELLFFLMQVPFKLPGNITYRADFMEFWKDGNAKVVDVKGFMTPVSQLKIKQIEDLYNIEIHIV